MGCLQVRLQGNTAEREKGKEAFHRNVIQCLSTSNIYPENIRRFSKRERSYLLTYFTINEKKNKDVTNCEKAGEITFKTIERLEKTSELTVVLWTLTVGLLITLLRLPVRRQPFCVVSALKHAYHRLSLFCIT